MEIHFSFYGVSENLFGVSGVQLFHIGHLILSFTSYFQFLPVRCYFHRPIFSTVISAGLAEQFLSAFSMHPRVVFMLSEVVWYRSAFLLNYFSVGLRIDIYFNAIHGMLFVEMFLNFHFMSSVSTFSTMLCIVTSDRSSLKTFPNLHIQYKSYKGF